MALNWKGDEVVLKVERAAVIGVNRCMALCVGGAKREHPFTNRSTNAEKSIRIAEAAKPMGSGVVKGTWGSVLNSYFIYLEMGTGLTRSRTSITNRLKPSAKRKKMNASAPPWNGGSWAPTLRPQASAFYPALGSLIQRAFASL